MIWFPKINPYIKSSIIFWETIFRDDFIDDKILGNHHMIFPIIFSLHGMEDQKCLEAQRLLNVRGGREFVQRHFSSRHQALHLAQLTAHLMAAKGRGPLAKNT